jgi:hypothetical protein
MHWSGQWACSDVGELRFVVDGSPTHANASNSPCSYPRDNQVTDAVVDDFMVLPAGKHLVQLQSENQISSSGAGLGIFQIFDWVMSTEAMKTS